MKRFNTIGILGGMGPEATAELYKRIIALFQSRHGAVDDSDYPNIIINSIPVDDMLNSLATRKATITRQLCSGAKMLQDAGVDFIVIPCNTAMIFYDELKNCVEIPVLNTVEIVMESGSPRTVGILASESTTTSSLYERGNDKTKIIYPDQDEQLVVDKAINNVLRGMKLESDIKNLLRISESLKIKGAEKIILGCTELPLLCTGVNQTYLDSVQLLAEKSVDYSLANSILVSSDVYNDL